MKNARTIFVILAFFLFTACEKEAIEPEVNTILDLNAVEKAHQSKTDHIFRAHLSGEQEVPPVDTRATGQAIFKLSKDGTVLSYKLIVANIKDVTMAHIHLAPAGENGPVVVWLYPEGPPPQLIEGATNGILAQGVITNVDLQGELEGASLEDLVDIIKSGGAYVNVHTETHGGGEIRGQIE